MTHAKAFFQLQVDFAHTVASLAGISLARALFEYTNLFLRFGLGRRPDERAEGWREYVAGLDHRAAVERTDEPVEQQSLRLHLDLLGADHPGIVAEVSASLADRRVSIDELSTDVREAPMAGGTLFEAHAVLTAPASTSTEELRSMLEGLADELMVEIRLSED